jgi:hypothetical protein
MSRSDYRRIEVRWKRDEFLSAVEAEASRRGMTLQEFTTYVMRSYYQACQGDPALLDELVSRSLLNQQEATRSP